MCYINTISIVWLLIHYTFSFRLGDEYYKVFTECVDILASEEEYDNPNSLESKKIQAFNSTKACAVMSKSMIEKMFKCDDVQLMGKLNEALHCIWELMWEYRDKISFTWMGSLILQQDKYRPTLLESRQHDCRALLVDIEIFCRNVTRFFANATDISKLHKAICLMYTTSRYLQDVVLANPCFHEMPPPPCPPKKPKRRNVCRSTWNY